MQQQQPSQVAQALSAAQQQLLPISQQLQHVVAQSAASFDMLVALCSCPCCADPLPAVGCHLQQQQQQQGPFGAAPASFASQQQLALVKQALESIQQYVMSIKPAWEILDQDMHRVWQYLRSSGTVSGTSSTVSSYSLNLNQPTDIDQLEGLLAHMQLDAAAHPPIAVLQQHLAAFKQLVAGVQQQQQLVVDLLRNRPPCACTPNKPARVEQLQAMLGGMQL